MEPKISVIVPVYKVEEYLHRCVDSILSQSFTDFELILVDDGSPDNCGKICDEYAQKDSRVKVIHKKNGGASNARNVGIKNATGEWITFIDADDYIEQNFLNIPNETTEDLLIQNYKQEKNNQITSVEFAKSVMCQTDMQNFIDENLHQVIFLSPWAKFYKRSLLNSCRITFIENIKVGEDNLFVLDYLFQTRSIRILGSSNYVYVGGFCVSKYHQSVEKSIEGIQLMMSRYNKLQANSKIFLTFRFLLYYNLISPKKYNTLKRWRKDSVVRYVYSIIYKELGFKWNLIYNNYAIYRIYQFYKKIINR